MRGLEGVADAEVGGPFESVVADDLIVELETVTGTNVELQGEGDVEFVLQTENSVGTGFSHDVPVLLIRRGGDEVGYRWIKTDTETAAKSGETPKSRYKVPFIHETGRQFERPKVIAPCKIIGIFGT